MQALDVHDPVAPVAGSVRPGRALDRVEREPDAGVARRVRVGLEAEPVELADHRAELAVGVARAAALPRPVRVVLEHQRRVRLDHVVGVELDRPEAQAVARRRRVDGVAELRAERGIRPHRMEQRGDHAGGEHALVERALEERQLGERHLRLDHGGDAERRRHAHARHELAVPALGRVHRDVALQLGEPGLGHGAGVEVGDPARRLSGHRMPLRATPGDVAAVGDAEHAQRHPVQPHRVLVVRGHEHRPVGEPVEVARLGTAALDDGVDRVLRAHPVELGPPGGEVGDAAAHLGEVVGSLERHRVLVEAEQQVVVAVDDAGCHQSPGGLDRAARRRGIRRAADVGDAVADDADGLGPRGGVVERAHAGAGDEQVEGHAAGPSVSSSSGSIRCRVPGRARRYSA